MAKAIIIRTPEFSIRYKENVCNEIEYQIKGIDGIHEARMDRIKHKFILEFLTGKRARRIFHIGCSGRKWRNPIISHEEFLQQEAERLREKEEADRRRAIETQKRVVAKARQELQEVAIERFFIAPSPDNWEELLELLKGKTNHSTVMDSTILPSPEGETSRKRVVSLLERASKWNKRLNRFIDTCAVYGWEVEIRAARGYVGDHATGVLEIKGSSLIFWAAESWGRMYEAYAKRCEARLKELNKLYA